MSLTGSRKYTIATARDGSRNFTVRANAVPSPGTTGGGGVSVQNSVKNYTGGLMEGIVDVNNEIAMRALYREMYFLDSIAGSAIDLMSNLPFSNFNLGGVKDKRVLTKNMECMDRLRLKLLLPAISIDYLALGAFLGSMNWNTQDKVFDSVMPQDQDMATLTPVPMLGADPLVDIKVPKDLLKALEKDDVRGRRLRAAMPVGFLEDVKKNGGTISLDPDNVLYIPRRSESRKQTGTSLLHRIVPIYMMEKALIRGTIEQAFTRRRAIKHITMGGEDDWVPGSEDLTSIAQLFLAAELDPDNAVVATPTGVSVNELAQGGDFWKYGDIYDFSATAKMRALGINDAFLSGDASYNTVEAALSVFIEQLKAYREMVTREVFYERIFPRIAEENDFRKKAARGVETAGLSVRDHLRYGERFLKDRAGNYVLAADERQAGWRDYSGLQIPTVIWHKRLEPEGDAAYIEMLNSLSDKGLPVPLRMLAGAAGLNMDDLLSGYEEDIPLRKRVSQYQKAIAQYVQQGGGSDDEGEGGAQEWARILADVSSKPSMQRGSLLQRLLARQRTDETGATEFHKNGRPRPTSRARSREIDRKINKRIARVRAKLAQRDQ